MVRKKVAPKTPEPPPEIWLSCSINWCRWSHRVDDDPALKINQAAQKAIREAHMRTHTLTAAHAEIAWCRYVMNHLRATPHNVTYVACSERIDYLQLGIREKWFTAEQPSR